MALIVGSPLGAAALIKVRGFSGLLWVCTKGVGVVGIIDCKGIATIIEI